MKRILLVEDNKMVRQAVKHFLEHQGYNCEEAENGAVALLQLRQGQKIDLILSDHHMPVMNGLDFLIQVRANSHFNSLTFILYSGNLTKEVERQAHQAGATAVLNTLLNFSDFNGIVTKALQAS